MHSRHFEYCPFTYSYVKLLLLSKSLNLGPIPNLVTYSREFHQWQNFTARKGVGKLAEQTKRQPTSPLLAQPSPTLSSQQTSCLSEKRDFAHTCTSFDLLSFKENQAFILDPYSYALNAPSLILVYQPSIPFLALQSFPPNWRYPIHTSSCPNFPNLKVPTLSFYFSQSLPSQMSQGSNWYSLAILHFLGTCFVPATWPPNDLKRAEHSLRSWATDSDPNHFWNHYFVSSSQRMNPQYRAGELAQSK